MVARAPDPRRLAAQQKKEAARNVRWVISVDDKEHIFRLSDVSALDAADLAENTRYSDPARLVGDAVEEKLDAVAAVIWMARRQAGEVELGWVDVAAEITFGVAIYIRHEDEPEDDGGGPFPDPPPLGGGSGE